MYIPNFAVRQFQAFHIHFGADGLWVVHARSFFKIYISYVVLHESITWMLLSAI